MTDNRLVSQQNVDVLTLRDTKNAARKAVLEGFGQDALAWDLIQKFRLAVTYDPKLTSDLITTGRDPDVEWNTRGLAGLLAEAQILRAPRTSRKIHFGLFETFGLLDHDAAGPRMIGDVIKMGFGTTSPTAFIGQFRKRLMRHAPLFASLVRPKLSLSTIASVIELTHQESRLFLTRFLFSPQEVVKRIAEQTNSSTGEINRFVMEQQAFKTSADVALGELPQYEAQIAAALFEDQRIWWVSDRTSSKIHRLIEYPRGTVVLVLKPPGSHLEIELKRTGLRGDQPLQVFFERKGKRVPPSHRLWGGDMMYFLRWEAFQGAWMSRMHRQLTGWAGPMSQTLFVANVRTVPAGKGEINIIDYLSSRKNYGKKYKKMRRAMKQTIAAFGSEREWIGKKRKGASGTTLQFLDVVAPGQSILVGSSSFRLDRLASDVSPDGATQYQRAIKTNNPSALDHRVFADGILDEILDSYRAPEVRYRTHKQYLNAAFADPENRDAADRCFLACMRQIGRYWAIFLATRSHSRGESMTSRNLGLRKSWVKGRWQVEVRFMDNDDLQIIGQSRQYFWPSSSLSGMNMDRVHLLGGVIGTFEVEGSVSCLEKIYRADSDLRLAGQQVFYSALRESYKSSLKGILSRPELKAFYSETFAQNYNDWDKVMGWYFRDLSKGRSIEDWEQRMRTYLSGRDYPEKLIDKYSKAVRGHTKLVEVFRQIIAPKTVP